MKIIYKNIIYSIGAVAIILPSIFFVHDYIFIISHLEKIEFEEISEYCYAECKTELEKQGYSCYRADIGYACVPPIDQQRINERREYWAYLEPSSYGYLELVYDDNKNDIGFLKHVEFLDENRIRATFKAGEQDESMDVKTRPDKDYEYSRVISIGDSFIPRCYHKYIFVYELHDIVITDSVSYAVLVYRIGTSDIDKCLFPEYLEHSFGRFDI